MLSILQKKTAEAIVNVFETGSALGDHANVTVVRGDPGHLTYGRSQTTLASGNLYLLIRAYAATDGAELAAALTPYLARLEARDLSLDGDMTLRGLLRQAGDDPVMRATQDVFFDSVYWAPAQARCRGVGISTALGAAAVYDSTVHGNWPAMRDATAAQVGSIGQRGVTEADWIGRYVQVRRQWLAGNDNALLRSCVYRMDAIGALIDARNWDLSVPIHVRGVLIDEAVLGGPPVRVSAHVIEERLLSLREPAMQGDDVAALQRALADHGSATVQADGVFGREMAEALTSFQQTNGLVADGIAGPATRAALGL